MISKTVYILVWSGEVETASRCVSERYPDAEIVCLSKRTLREGGWRGQLRAFRQLMGEALVFFFRSANDVPQKQLLVWSGLIHRCRETVIADAAGNWNAYRRRDFLWLAPTMALSLLGDLAVFMISWVALHLMLRTQTRRPQFGSPNADFDLAYLFPFPLDRSTMGGAMSHVRGLLGGLSSNDAKCEVFAGTALPIEAFPVQVIEPGRKRFIFWEALMLAYNLRFARKVVAALGKRKPRAIYQRHRRFVVAGALLSRWLRVPLVLEYNSSERWTATHWDPSRFVTWLGLCEDVSLAAASLIVVVSEPLRQQLLEAGIEADRILVNPNGVDPAEFRPDVGGRQLRTSLGIDADEVVVCFVGTFSYWHGIPVLQSAITELAQGTDLKMPKLRFLLVGDGPLVPDMRSALERFVKEGTVIFTGAVSHAQVVEFLDAADILVSPHLPTPDGRPFFGSPTKLFEYMAMSKGIIASNLDQLAVVLQHGESAWLVEPGNVSDLVAAICLLANRPELREQLGRNARIAAMARHTWQQNALRVLERIGSPSRSKTPALQVSQRAS